MSCSKVSETAELGTIAYRDLQPQAQRDFPASGGNDIFLMLIKQETH
jgi:hypothetical protein